MKVFVIFSVWLLQSPYVLLPNQRIPKGKNNPWKVFWDRSILLLPVFHVSDFTHMGTSKYKKGWGIGR